MFTNRTLKNFLEEISDGAKFVQFHFASPECFEVELKCKVDVEQPAQFYNQYVASWIEKFSKFTATTWNVRTSFPRIKRLAYRKVFVCHRSAFNKKRTCTKSRNQECRANIDFKVKLINKNTIRNDQLLKQGLNMSICINFRHTHKVGARESYNLLKSTSDTDNIFYEYFNHGHTPVTAKAYHEMLFIDKYGEKSVELSNATINPNMRHVLYLHDKRKLKQVTPASFDDIMLAKKEKLTMLSGILNYDNPHAVVVISATMRRLISEMILDDIVIDSVSISDHTTVTLLYLCTKIGALCFACILHMGQTETDYSQAFFAGKLTLETEFNKNFDPKSILVNNLNGEKNALSAIFPTSKITVSPWSICSATWRWFCDDDNKIDRQMRHSLMVVFSSMVHSNSVKLARDYYEKLDTDEYVTGTSALHKYITDIWAENNWMTDADDKNELIELSVRINREIVVSKCKSFNIYAMVDVVSNILDSHCRETILAHVKGESNKKVYTKFLNKSETVLNLNIGTRIVAKAYKIEVKYEKRKKYIQFRTDTWYCDCKTGKRGEFCEHLCAIINATEVYLNTPELTEDEKHRFIKITGGDIYKCDSSKNSGIEESEAWKKKQDTFKEEDVSQEIENSDQASVGSVNSAVDDYYYLEVKTETNKNPDPLESSEPEVENIMSEPIIKNTNTLSDFKISYENALRAVNGEFRRLNKFFKENPNVLNKETMIRLAKELGKIKPVERVNLNNMCIEVNCTTRKRKYSEADNN